MTAVMISTMVLCFALTVSVAVSIGLSAMLGIQVANVNMLISVKEMFNAINKFPLAAIPFFILAGNLMETGGIFCVVGIIGNLLDPVRMELETAQ